MIRIAVLYPHSEGKSFDAEYYQDRHFQLVKEKLVPLGLQGLEFDHGLQQDGPQPFVAIGYLLFESLTGFQAAFGQVGAELMADIPNFTDIEPLVQISEHRKFSLR